MAQRIEIKAERVVTTRTSYTFTGKQIMAILLGKLPPTHGRHVRVDQDNTDNYVAVSGDADVSGICITLTREETIQDA